MMIVPGSKYTTMHVCIVIVDLSTYCSGMSDNYNFPTPLVATISLELDETFIIENDTFLEVCANVTEGWLERDVEVQLSSMSGSATGNQHSV